MDTLKLYQGHPHENGRHCTSCGVFKTADQFHLERDSKAKNGITMRGQCRPCREHIKWKSFIVRTYGITVIVAGHEAAVATAQQITKTESYRDPDSFADIVRGMHLYGRKILRPEAIVTAKYNAA